MIWKEEPSGSWTGYEGDAPRARVVREATTHFSTVYIGWAIANPDEKCGHLDLATAQFHAEAAAEWCEEEARVTRVGRIIGRRGAQVGEEVDSVTIEVRIHGADSEAFSPGAVVSVRLRLVADAVDGPVEVDR